MNLRLEAVEEALFAEAVRLKGKRTKGLKLIIEKTKAKQKRLTVFERFTLARATLQRLQLATGMMKAPGRVVVVVSLSDNKG